MLLVVLVALFALTVIVCGLQYMAMGTLRQTRVALQADDSFYRAEGVVGLLTSRWKKEIRYRQGGPLTSPPSGVEAGQWDGRTYVLGWEREELPTRVPESRATAWIRFPDGRPIRTYRYDLRLRFPRLLDPRAVEITGLSLDSVDPAVESQRKQAFVRPGEAVDSVAAREARVEAHSTVVEQLAGPGCPAGDQSRDQAGLAVRGRHGAGAGAGPARRQLRQAQGGLAAGQRDHDAAGESQEPRGAAELQESCPQQAPERHGR
ncbi:MAG: hypothetical protein HY815_12340 [Candidatus Riflebacteria bacterium]|nr:hypothetical protein [Candidatus Riflebacteria bacterium]